MIPRAAAAPPKTLQERRRVHRLRRSVQRYTTDTQHEARAQAWATRQTKGIRKKITEMKTERSVAVCWRACLLGAHVVAVRNRVRPGCRRRRPHRVSMPRGVLLLGCWNRLVPGRPLPSLPRSFRRGRTRRSCRPISRRCEWGSRVRQRRALALRIGAACISSGMPLARQRARTFEWPLSPLVGLS